MRSLIFSLFFVFSGFAVSTAAAQPMEYVRICDSYGAGWYYIPGSEDCLRPETGDIRRQSNLSPKGYLEWESELASRISGLEGNMGDAFANIAISNALQNPDLVAGESFGLRVNWGTAGSEHAFGLSGAVVLSDGLFEKGRGRLTGSGGIAFSGGEVGGGAGLQLSW